MNNQTPLIHLRKESIGDSRYIHPTVTFCGEQVTSNFSSTYSPEVTCPKCRNTNEWPEPSAPPAEQTAEETHEQFLNKIVTESKPLSGRHLKNAMIGFGNMFAEFYHRQQLEAAAKELPNVTDNDASDILMRLMESTEAYQGEGQRYHELRNMNLAILINSELRDKAAPIIAQLNWQLEVQKGITASNIAAAEKLGPDIEALHSRVRELEARLLRSNSALEYAAFNYDGMKLEHLLHGITDSTGVSETCLITVRDNINSITPPTQK